MNTCSQRLKELREARGLSPSQAARGLRVSAQMYRYQERISKPRADFIIKAAKFFEVSADYLLGLCDNFR